MIEDTVRLPSYSQEKWKLPSHNPQKNSNTIKEIALMIMQSEAWVAAKQAIEKIIVLTSALAIRVMDLIRQLALFTLDLIRESPSSTEAIMGNEEATLPPTLNLQDMTPEALKMAFDQLSKQDLDHLEDLSDPMMALIEQPEFWKLWAKQLSIPIVEGEDPRQTITNLLRHFNIDPVSGKATLLKSIAYVKEALEHYPGPVWLVVPIANSTQLNFYCRHPCGKYMEYKDVDQTCFHSELTREINKITEDDEFTQLFLSNL